MIIQVHRTSYRNEWLWHRGNTSLLAWKRHDSFAKKGPWLLLLLVLLPCFQSFRFDSCWTCVPVSVLSAGRKMLWSLLWFPIDPFIGKCILLNRDSQLLQKSDCKVERPWSVQVPGNLVGNQGSWSTQKWVSNSSWRSKSWGWILCRKHPLPFSPGVNFLRKLLPYPCYTGSNPSIGGSKILGYEEKTSVLPECKTNSTAGRSTKGRPIQGM